MKWFFEPGHTAAEFRARHMMITWVRGSFKNIHGFETVIDASTCWTGVEARDNHLRSPDFLSCERYPEIRFKSTGVSQIGPVDYRVTGDLTIRETTRPATLDVRYLGTWETPWWEDGVDKGRYDFGVDWNDQMPNGGVVVSPQIDIVIDVEAVKED